MHEIILLVLGSSRTAGFTWWFAGAKEGAMGEPECWSDEYYFLKFLPGSEAEKKILKAVFGKYGEFPRDMLYVPNSVIPKVVELLRQGEVRQADKIISGFAGPPTTIKRTRRPKKRAKKA
jgi:hypothetical protein